MKTAMWIPFALLVGLMVGAWGPRARLKHANSEVKRLEELLKRGGGSGRAARLDGITRMLRIPDADSKGGKPTETDSRDETTDGSTQESNGSASTAEVVSASQETGVEEETAPEEDGSERERRRRGMAERIDEAVELWQLRSDIARSTFISNAGLSHEEAAQFDVLVESMNMRLRERIGTWAEEIQVEEFEMTEENGVRMMNDLSSVMVLTYDEMNRTMPEGWRQDAGNEFNLTDMIDPSVATPLINVEDKLERRPRRRRLLRP